MLGFLFLGVRGSFLTRSTFHGQPIPKKRVQFSIFVLRRLRHGSLDAQSPSEKVMVPGWLLHGTAPALEVCNVGNSVIGGSAGARIGGKLTGRESSAGQVNESLGQAIGWRGR